jgi:dihydroxy-acid dehydratase
VHTGKAVVFENYDDMLNRIDDDSLPVDESSVLVLRNAGPKAVPGMPEWGMIPIPKKLRKTGVVDMLRISDARMSGTSFGTVILHITPEAAVGGPLAFVQNGDQISFDAVKQELTLRSIRRRIEPEKSVMAASYQQTSTGVSSTVHPGSTGSRRRLRP